MKSSHVPFYSMKVLPYKNNSILRYEFHTKVKTLYYSSSNRSVVYYGDHHRKYFPQKVTICDSQMMCSNKIVMSFIPLGSLLKKNSFRPCSMRDDRKRLWSNEYIAETGASQLRRSYSDLMRKERATNLLSLYFIVVLIAPFSLG